MHKLYFVFFLCVTCISNVNAQDRFYAYHTNVPHTATDYFGKYADLIVVLGEGKQLEFTRRNQYSPVWVTPDGSYPIDEFIPEREEDYQLDYTYVRLLAQEEGKIIVHWRYMPEVSKIDTWNANLNPTNYAGFTNVVHEVFTIYPSGTVEREVKDARESKYDSWINPDYADRQTFQLTEEGVEYGRVVWGDKSLQFPEVVSKRPIKSTVGLEEPALSWSFDEGGGDYPDEVADSVEEVKEEEPAEIYQKTFESQTMEGCDISGHAAVYKKGVSGTALAFDGYYTGVSIPAMSRQAGTTYYQEIDIPEFENELTIESWIALDVYPFNVAPIVHQSKGFGEEGFYLGVNPYGNLVMTVNGTSVTSSEKLELYRWTHVAAVVSGKEIQIYIDGKQVGSTSYKGEKIGTNADLLIGLNSEKERCSDYVRSPMQNIEFIYGIQGLLDEMKLYSKALSSKQLSKHYTAFTPQDRTSDLQKAILPGEVGVADQFGAYYKNLEHHELWDKMWRLADQTNVVVKFDNSPASVVYWHGTNFAANWVVDNNRWMADQSSEIFTKYGCSEHMADKQTRHSYARLIENNDARVVVHWRYPCVDVGYVCTDKRNWTDEYHTIYPDGTAVRKVVFNGANPPDFQDIQLFTNPGETALDVVDIHAATVANLQGDTYDLVWVKPNNNPEVKLDDAMIELVNTKSNWKVYAIYPGPGVSTWGEFEQSKYTDDPFAGPWNHWPVSLVPSDGRYAVAHDRVTHFALGANDAAAESGMLHYGFTNGKIDQLVSRGRFWHHPPLIQNLKGATNDAFKQDQKAYVLTGDGSDKIRFEVPASPESPLVNPAFMIKKFNSDKLMVSIGGKTLQPGKGLRLGTSYDTNGEKFQIVWMELETEKLVQVEFSR